MIINTGGRTDTVQYYAKWLLKRFEEGCVLSRNPLFPNKVSRYELTPEKVDCIQFCSKNYEPILTNLSKITDRFNTYFHYTITAYGQGSTIYRKKYRDIEKVICRYRQTAYSMAL